MESRRLSAIVTVIGSAVLALGLTAGGPAAAAPFGGVEFPAGAVSFADVVTTFAPAIVAGEPTAPNLVSARTLGVPDCATVTDCFASLGDGGTITLEFTDNRLTGSGSNAQDLYIFEFGPDIEATFVEVSADGTVFTPVGRVSGQPSGIDVDAFGFGTSSQLRFVRITDDTAEGGQTGATVGADIDAVGAISSAAPTTTTTTSTTLPTGASTSTTTVATTTSSTSTTIAAAVSTTVAPTRLATTGGPSPLAFAGAVIVLGGLYLLWVSRDQGRLWPVENPTSETHWF